MSVAADELMTGTKNRQPRAGSRWVRLVVRRFWRPGVVALLCLGATGGVAHLLNDTTAIETWMVWKLALIWFWALVFGAGCLGLGLAICRPVLRAHVEIPTLERVALASAVGAAAFATSMYLLGALRLFRPAVALMLPVLGIVLGLGRKPFARLASLRGIQVSLGVKDLAVLVLGGLSLALIYLHVLNPSALSYDAGWTHLVIAQDYAREHRLVRFSADWAKNFPHLASLFYTWVFLVPGMNFSLRVPLIMHVEFGFLIGTLLGVTALSRWLTEEEGSGTGGRVAWVTFFLFSGIFVSDSNLGGSADHIAALFTAPLFLLLARGSERRFSPGLCALGGALAGSALITKYQTIYVTLPLGLLVAARLVQTAWRSWRGRADESARRVLVALGWMVGAAIVTASPFFLENLAFHHNPVYPFKQDLFTGSTPTMPDANFMVSVVLTPENLSGGKLSFGKKALEALKAVFTFSFLPHYSFQGKRPYFGFLFTILSPLALFLPRAHRLRVAALLAGAGLFTWAMTYLVDRNLQIVLPLLVSVTAGVIIKVWRLGWIARAGLLPLMLLQLVWQGDLMFQDYLAPGIDHIRNGINGRAYSNEIAERRAMAAQVPWDGKVLLHGEHAMLGFNRDVLSDEMGFEGLIDYRTLRTAREAYDRFRALGLTHIVWLDQNEPGISMQRAVVFNALVRSLPLSTHGRYSMVPLGSEPPPATPPLRVMTLGMAGLRNGIYRVDILGRCELRPAEACVPPQPEVPVAAPVTPSVLTAGVDALLMPPNHVLEPEATTALNERFRPAWPGGRYLLYLRR